MVFFGIIAVEWGWTTEPPIIRSDAEGYYGYLRAIFITKDLGHERPNWTYVNGTPEGTLNKYFAGEAVMLLPFFLGGHLWAHLSGARLDGLSEPYQRSVGIAALCYVFIGLWAFRSFLRRAGVRDGIIAFIIILLACGTQLVQYVTIQPGWSHTYSFALFALFLLAAQRFLSTVDARGTVALGLLYGLIVLVRPVNGLVLLALPLVWGDRTKEVLRGIWQKPLLPPMMGVAACGVVSIQLFLWHLQVGHWLAYGYKGEGFHWDRPQVMQVLFSVRRGLFVWAPVLLAAAGSVLMLWRADRTRSMAAAIYWAANTYVISCWWIWYYGSGWGQRVFVDHYPVLFFSLALVLQRAGPWALKAVMTVLSLLCVFTLAQFYQYKHGLIDEECMDRGKYAYSFMRFDEARKYPLGGRYRVPPFNPNGLDTLMHERWDGTTSTPHWSGTTRPWPGAPSGTEVMELSGAHEFGPAFVVRANELPRDRALYLALGFERMVLGTEDSRDILMVASINEADGTMSFYDRFRMEPLPPVPGVWQHLEYRLDAPPVKEGATLKLYFWNQRWQRGFLADDLDLTLMAVRPY